MSPSHPAANGFQPAKRLPYVDHFCGRYCVDLEASRQHVRAGRFYGPDALALGRGRISQETRIELYERYAGEDGKTRCFNPGCNEWLCLNVGEIQSGSGQQRRTLMHASHVEAASNMAELRDEGFNFEALDDIENLRCCCANCNGDMRQHNMFSFLDIVGRFMEDEYARWRQWRASL